MQRSAHTAQKAASYDPRVFAQPTRHSIAAALAAQRREREAFAKATGSRVDRDGHISRQHRHD